MAIEKLTQTMVEALVNTGTLPRRKKGARGREGGPGWYGDGGGLYLQLKPELTASWVFRFKRDGKTRVMGLGPLHTIDLAEARRRAAKHRLALLDGVTPVARRERGALWTFGETAARCHAVVGKTIGNDKHRKAWLAGIKTHCGALLTVPVRDVTLKQVAEVLEPIWGEEKGGRLRERLEKVFDHALANGQRTEANPALLKALQHLLGARRKMGGDKHHEHLPYDELPAFMADLRGRNRNIAGLALEFVILTAVRTGDVRGQPGEGKLPMQWEHVDFDARTWTIPNTKTGRPLVVPLSDPALALLERVRGAGLSEHIVFPSPYKGGKTPMGADAMLYYLQVVMGREETVHGFRATFKTWCSEQMRIATETLDGVQGSVVEVALGHGFSEDKVEAAYMRGGLLQKRRDLMAAWADFAGGKDGKVIKLVAA